MKKILVVDDEPFNVEILKGLLSKKYAVETAANGEEAFRKVKEISPDLILLDVIMPEIDGYEVCRQLKSDQKTMNIPIVMVTCLTDRNDRIKAIEAGADDFLSKPIDWIELSARVKSLLRIKQYLDDIEESKNRYIKLYDFAPVGYFTFTHDGLIREVNLTGGVLLGLGRQELVKSEFWSFVVPENLELWAHHISSVLNHRDEQSCELTLKREDGSMLFVRLNSLRMETGEGTPEIFTAITDITQRKQTETELKRSNDFMSTVLNSIDDAICIIDVQNYKILGFNSTFQKEHGLEEKQIIGEHCYKITHNNTQPCKLPDCVCALFETLRTGKHAVVEHLHYGANGKKIYREVSTSPVRNEMGQIIKVVHSTRNTTERKLVEEHLNQVNIELKRADELKTQFLSVISHEMRTPLTPINAQLQMMLAGYFGEITEKQAKSLEMILRNTGRLDRLIGDVLDFSKLESGVMKFNMVPASMNEIVENAVETLKIHALNKNLKIILKEDNIPPITIDKDRITQVILNLIHNAIKFTDAGGVIEVELSCNSENVTVKVKDTGIGIGTKDIDKLFKPFQQLDSSYGRKYEGSGLGLVICNRIIMNHGGKIWVESEFGKGTAFIFSIPFIHEVKEEKAELIMFEDENK